MRLDEIGFCFKFIWNMTSNKTQVVFKKGDYMLIRTVVS